MRCFFFFSWLDLLADNAGHVYIVVTYRFELAS